MPGPPAIRYAVMPRVYRLWVTIRQKRDIYFVIQSTFYIFGLQFDDPLKYHQNGHENI